MSRKIFLYVTALIVMVLGVLLFVGLSSEQDRRGDLVLYDKVNSRPTIIVGDDIDYPPYSYLDKDGRPQGFNLELIQEAASVMGYNVEFRLDKWARTRESLEKGEIDAIAGMFYSDERDELYSFTTRHARTIGDIFTGKGERVNSVHELRGKQVVVQSGDIVHEYLLAQDLEIDIVEFATVTEALEAVSSGEYKYAALLSIPGHYILEDEGIENVQPQGLSLDLGSYSMATQKDDSELAEILNSGLYIVSSTGKYDEIYDKWLGIYEEKTARDFVRENRPYIVASFIFIVIAITLLLSWNMTLKKMVNAKTYQLQKSNDELKKNKEHAEYLAYYDYLTGLPNRIKFNQVLEKELHSYSKGAVMMMDIDNFKSINDISGHAFGDIVLKEIADILRESARENFFISRFGGDEFLILVKKESNLDDLSNYAKEILLQFKKSIYIQEQEVNLSFSMGISLFPKDGRSVEGLLMKADTAMHGVKSSGKKNFAFFDKKMGDELRRKIEIRDILKDAFMTDGFRLLYQPQISCRDGRIVGFEALIRLNNKGIYPDQFIPVAEESGIIVDIGRWVAETAIKQLKHWENQGFELKPIAINFSAKQMKDRSFHDFLRSRLDHFRIDPSYIEIEITEGVLLDNTKEAIQYLERFREMGVKIALDDFGTGYSSISYLTYMPVDKIKLDKSLNDEFLDMENTEVMESIISLGHSLDLKITAEGIEEVEQFQKLKKGNCDYIQGYLFAKPMSAKDIEGIYDRVFL